MACYRNSHFQKSSQSQRGRGAGNVLRSLYNKVTPAVKYVGSKVLASPISKAALSAVKDIAVNASLNVLKETLQGNELSKSVGNNVSVAKRKLNEALLKQLYKQLRRGKKPLTEKRVAKRRKIDFLFDDDSVPID